MINRSLVSDDFNAIKSKLEKNEELSKEEKSKLREDLTGQDIHPDFYQLKVV
jgi:hypothetical protein